MFIGFQTSGNLYQRLYQRSFPEVHFSDLILVSTLYVHVLIKISSIEDDPDLIISPQEPVLPLKIPEKEKAPVYGITKAQVHPVPSWAVEAVAVEQIGSKQLSVVLETVKRGNPSHLFTRMDTATDSMLDWLKRNSHIIDPRGKIDPSPSPNIGNPVLDMRLASDPAVKEDLPSCSGQRVVKEFPTTPSSSPKLETLANSSDLIVRKKDVGNLTTMLWNVQKSRSPPPFLAAKRKFRSRRSAVKNTKANRTKEKDESKDRNPYCIEKPSIFFVFILFLSVTFFNYFLKYN